MQAATQKKFTDKLTNDKPCMIARFGANELNCIYNYIGVKKQSKDAISYVKGVSPAWWWKKSIIQNMHVNAGFFPPLESKIEEFCELMLNDILQLNVLGSWLPNEKYIKSLPADVVKIRFLFLDPYWSENPWTRALEGKKVLVIHPFAETIKEQYKRRELLFINKCIIAFFNEVVCLGVVGIFNIICFVPCNVKELVPE